MDRSRRTLRSIAAAARAGGTADARHFQQNTMQTTPLAPKPVSPGALIAIFTACCLPAPAAKQEPAPPPQPAIELGAPFCDNAVLQREMPVPVWGWGKPGTKFTVAFAGQQKTAAAGPDGKWSLKLDPLKASDRPAEMSIRDDTGKQVTLRNLLVGEVWMASGQSNMQWLAGKSDCAELQVEAKDGVAPIREFEVTSVYAALHPVEHATGAWKNGDYANYSAIALAFAHKLHAELGVPVGILNCSFSQTAIQAWIPRAGFKDADDDYTRAIYRKILETDPTTPEHKAAWDKFYQDLENTVAGNAALVKDGRPAAAISTKTPGNLNGNRDASWMYNGRLHPVVPFAIRGAIWNQGYANMGEGLPYYHNLHSLVRGWRLVWGQGDFPVYFHQFYCPGGYDDGLSLNPTAEMRLGTWLARDIPNTGMASQIDITGAIHYRNKALPGRRLALHALKNQYGRKGLAADGPMFKDYKVDGDRLTVEFEFADGGLVVGKTTMGKFLETPAAIETGDDRVTLFYLAGKDRVWHRAKLRLDGDKAVLTAPGVSEPRGVAYGCNGVGELPNLYNRALLPLTPFISYDHKLVTSDTWPDDPVKVAGVKIDPATVGKREEYRKMPLLSTQFRDHAVLQAGMPVTIWGSAVHDWGYEAKGKAEVKFVFAGIEKTIPVTPGMKEWQVTMPPMPASAEPKTLSVRFEIDGELAHERVCSVVLGDVWYVCGIQKQDAGTGADGPVRVMTRKSKRSLSPRPSRFSVAISTTPDNRFASEWKDAKGGLAEALGSRIHARTGKPVGIIYMNGDAPGSKGDEPPELRHWIDAEHLNLAPSLIDDYNQLAALRPGSPPYDANVRRYIADWKRYWGESIPQLMASRRVPDGAAWGSYPSFADADAATKASQAYNVMVHSFCPGSFKGILFLCSKTMFEKDQGANYAEQLSALANCWKQRFACADPHFVYTIPAKTLAPKITRPAAIKGKSAGVEIDDWNDAADVAKLIERAVADVYQ